MNRYSVRSSNCLHSCSVSLQHLFQHVLPIVDHTIFEGYRAEKDHLKYFDEKLTKVPYYKSKHSRRPSAAIHVLPCPLLWPEDAEDDEDELWRFKRIYYFAGVVIGVANKLDIPIRWGGNWKGCNTFKQSFDDLCHYELID